MSTSDTDSEHDEFDDDIDINNPIDDWASGDGSINDTDLFRSTFDTILNTNGSIDIVDQSLDEEVRTAMNASLSPPINTSGIFTEFGDSIDWYLTEVLPFSNVTKSSSYFLSVDRPSAKSLLSDKIYVGNIPFECTWRGLKAFFGTLGFDVAKVDLKKVNVSIEMQTALLNTILISKFLSI